MPGRALEIALATSDIGRSFEYWTRLGFGNAQTGDVWSWPYGVLTAPRLNLGLHATSMASPLVMLVRPDVAGLVPLLEERGVAIEDVRLGTETFNELTFADPAGVPVRVLEARTFSPPATSGEAVLGRFDAVSWPVPDVEAVAAFWQRLHVDTEPREGDWAALRADLGGHTLAWHSPRICTEPLLVFRHPDLKELRGRLAALDLAPQSRGASFTGPSVLLSTPEGQKLAILA